MSRVHREDATFTIELKLVAEFDESYEGDDDGFAWLREFRATLQPQIAQAVLQELRAHPKFNVRISSSGRNPEDFLEVTLNRHVAGKRLTLSHLE
jgi:hypothetical protein